MAKRRTRLSLRRDPALSASRMSIGRDKLVYLLIADKKFIYPDGKSRVVYIGTTKKGVARISQSVAAKAEEILSLHGVRTFHARVVTCRPRQRVKTWLKLERALLLGFRELYGSVPTCNSHGKNITEVDEFSYFAKNGITLVLEELA
jgi:hypothetical protein